MSINVIQERLASYACVSSLEEELALREITQEIILAGLSRSGFFTKSAFQGGTCLRIFHSLNRFSEDLDFALEKSDPSFDLAPYLHSVREELSPFGYEIEIDDRSKKGTAVQEAFPKDNSPGKRLLLNYRPQDGPERKIRVKFAVDSNPPIGASFEVPTLDYPFPAAVRTFDLPSLFAGKVHALLCRSYLKGRDWYDFIWYTARRIRINHALLSASLDQMGPWRGQNVTTDDRWCQEQLKNTISILDWKQVRQDVERFLKPHELPSLLLWNANYFLRQVDKVGDDR